MRLIEPDDAEKRVFFIYCVEPGGEFVGDDLACVTFHFTNGFPVADEVGWIEMAW